ncbi:hypothetical protein [Nonomuraea sp. NPDC050310]|uniref:hypothetical protein n=1 Tax=Nonomuraea sp. NPDC050310 TaxID=3154935 RepID=UPI00340BD2E1
MEYPLPFVPTSDFLHYLADAQRECSTGGDANARRTFKRIHNLYLDGTSLACAWIVNQPDLQKLDAASVEDQPAPAITPARLDGRLWATGEAAALQHLPARDDLFHRGHTPFKVGDIDQLRLFLAGLVADCPTREHAITRIRGAQAGFLAHGLLLALPSPLHQATGRGLTIHFTADDAERIRTRVVHPVHAAALALVLLTGLSARQLIAVPISALSGDASHLAVHERLSADPSHPGSLVEYGIPPYVQPLVGAARLFLLRCGASDDSSLLADGFGRSDQILLNSARRCALPVHALISRRQGVRPWDLQARCWRIGAPLHCVVDDGEPTAADVFEKGAT